MITDLIIKKNNVLTDGNIPDRQVLTEKLANVIYHLYEKNGCEFKISIPELLRVLDISTKGNNPKRLKDALQTLQSPIELRNFEYKGKGITWFSAPFLSRAYIEKEHANVVNIKLDDMLIEALKQHSTYTVIDLEMSNKFKTKYGITLWQMYLRYKNMQKQGSDATKLTYQHKTLEELNKKFGTNYKTPSELKRRMQPGIKEIKEITGVQIAINWDKREKKFAFVWQIKEDNYKNNFKHFRNWVIENYTNELLTHTEHTDRKKQITSLVPIAVDRNGYIIDLDEIVAFDANQAKEIWRWLFEHQDTIIAFKQRTLF